MGSDVNFLGRMLILFGVLLLGAGLVCLLVPRIPWLGRLPGDLVIQRERFVFYVPLTSCLAASAVLSLLVWVASRFRR